LNAKIGVLWIFRRFWVATHIFKSGSIHARQWCHLAYVGLNKWYPMSVAGSMSLDLFAVGLQTCTAVARSLCVSWAFLVCPRHQTTPCQLNTSCSKTRLSSEDCAIEDNGKTNTEKPRRKILDLLREDEDRYTELKRAAVHGTPD